MHVAVEKARKAAGISSLKKNYPENPKERGCGFWAAFIGVISDQLSQMDSRALKDSQTISDLSNRLADLEAERSKDFKRAVTNGITAIGNEEGWTPDKMKETTVRIAG
jgi:hypothetical protein